MKTITYQENLALSYKLKSFTQFSLGQEKTHEVWYSVVIHYLPDKVGVVDFAKAQGLVNF